DRGRGPGSSRPGRTLARGGDRLRAAGPLGIRPGRAGPQPDAPVGLLPARPRPDPQPKAPPRPRRRRRAARGPAPAREGPAWVRLATGPKLRRPDRGGPAGLRLGRRRGWALVVRLAGRARAPDADAADQGANRFVEGRSADPTPDRRAREGLPRPPRRRPGPR